VEGLANAFSKAVAGRTRGNHRLGILLSGGVDSRSVLAADHEGRISVAFTLGDFENQELQIARKIAATKGCRHVFLHRNLDHYARLVDEAVSIGDGLYRFDHAHYLGFFEQIRKEVDILFNGLFLDNFFNGDRLPRVNWRVVGKRVSLPMLQKLSFSAMPI
jgi:asparagine synthase (glutamine-hydrolysing)